MPESSNPFMGSTASASAPGHSSTQVSFPKAHLLIVPTTYGVTPTTRWVSFDMTLLHQGIFSGEEYQTFKDILSAFGENLKDSTVFAPIARSEQYLRSISAPDFANCSSIFSNNMAQTVTHAWDMTRIGKQPGESLAVTVYANKREAETVRQNQRELGISIDEARFSIARLEDGIIRLGKEVTYDAIGEIIFFNGGDGSDLLTRSSDTRLDTEGTGDLFQILKNQREEKKGQAEVFESHWSFRQ